MEWELHPQNFQEICEYFGNPEIDLFASRLNHKVPKYISCRPKCLCSVNWSKMYFYAFPPFNMIGKVLQKIELEHCTGIVMVPKWTTQTWWPKFMQLCNGNYIVLSRRKGRKMLTHSQRNKSELPKMKLASSGTALVLQYRVADLSDKVINIIAASRKDTTQKTVQNLSQKNGIYSVLETTLVNTHFP
jgi:hypothetical protein